MGSAAETPSQIPTEAGLILLQDDAIRKKMQSMKAETDDLYKKINEYETAAKEANGISDKYDAEIRDMGKKVAKLECSMEETLEKLQTSSAKMEDKDKEEDVNARPDACSFLKKRCESVLKSWQQ